MVIVRLNYSYLERLVGTTRETLLTRLPMLGSDVDRIEDDHVDVEFFPDRPDLFSTEGVAHALRGFLGIEPGITTYVVHPSPITFSVDPKLASIRPFLGSAAIRHVQLTDEAAIESLMELQEALHWAIGRGRSKVAIGIHDLDHVKPPFRYYAAPRTRAFIPLDFSKEMTMEEILDEHPKGRDYAHIVSHFPLFPLIVDANDDVLSFPPIINGELTRVTSKTRNILLDTTGTDLKAVTTTVRIICAAFAETGARIDQVTIDGRVWPDLTPQERSVSVHECSRLLGISLTPQRMAALLELMRFGATPAGPDAVRVEVPCFRGDIMHDWDLFEDVAIAHGYENFSYELPPVCTIGKKHRVTIVTDMVRRIFVGLGYIEMMPFTLSNEHIMVDRMQRPRSPEALHVMHPISEEHTIVRTDILPLLIEILQLNRHRELPQRLFAVGDVVNGTSTFQNVAAVSIHQDADFSEAYACMDALCRELQVEYTVKESADPAFLNGRRGGVYVRGECCGIFGELHPAVLNAFELEHPVAALELALRAVPGFHGLQGTP